jgi:putative transcriptional regulator
VSACARAWRLRRLAALGSPGRHYIGLTSFGAPVDGLQRGMLLVAITAGGPFHESVCYVVEHSDAGTFAVILNKPVETYRGTRADGGTFPVSLRAGGPLDGDTAMCNVPVPGSERLLAGARIYFSRRAAGVFEAVGACEQPDAAMVFVRGLASWGAHQLEGEVRRGSWGWVLPEDVSPADIFETDAARLDGAWERLVHAPRMHIFEG